MDKFHCPSCGAAHKTENEQVRKVETMCSCGATLKLKITDKFIEVTACGIEDEE